MLDTPCSEVVWRVLATHSILRFPLHFPSRASPCAITFKLGSTTRIKQNIKNLCVSNATFLNPPAGGTYTTGLHLSGLIETSELHCSLNYLHSCFTACLGSSGWWPVSHRRGPVSIPVRPMWDVWWIKWQWGRFLCKYLGVTLSASFHQCSIPSLSLYHWYRMDKCSQRWGTFILIHASSNVGDDGTGKHF